MPCCSITFTLNNKWHTIKFIFNAKFWQPFNINSLIFIFANWKWIYFIRVLEQIKQLFIINLNKRTINLDVLSILVSYLSKKFFYASRDYTTFKRGHNFKQICLLFQTKVSSKHGVGFSRTSLTISENSTIEAEQYIFNAFLYKIKYLFLSWILSENLIIFVFHMIFHIS